ncbi:MAG: flagellar type III secretion system pore protein FliP [Planctomycetota bacterium]|nr:flagellar type III secretion system pore protein FliP [Planctomycetota bacterium]
MNSIRRRQGDGMNASGLASLWIGVRGCLRAIGLGVFVLSVVFFGGLAISAQEVGASGVGASGVGASGVVESRLGRSLSQRSAVQREPEVVKPTAQPILPETLERLSKSASKTSDGRWLQGVEQWVGPKGLSQTIQTLLLLTLLSAAPAALLMTTCYVRVVIVLGVLKQALGNQQLPPSQVLSGISLFITLFVMSPVWKQVYDDSIVPYTAPESTMRADEAWDRGIAPVHRFMARQIAMAGNYEDVHLFYSRYAPESTPPDDFQSVPLIVLLPAYMLSELKTAFLMGFQIYLPFLVLDLVIAAVISAMGMTQLSPAMVSIPFKLLLFVLVDGWRLVVQMLLDSFGSIGSMV